jgi:cytochrome c peroxidase
MLFPCLFALLSAAVAAPTPRPLAVPAGWPAPANLPTDNPLTEEGVELGRVLFNDRRLSARHRQSCANCHRERLAFADGGAFSTGADGVQGTRSSPPIFNEAWHPAFSWDGKQSRLRDQAKTAITNPTEMHADPATIEADLRGDAAMRARFLAAFGSPDITFERVGLALEQFMLTHISADSRFDRASRGEAALSAEEARGRELFFTEHNPAKDRRGAGCFQCHGTEQFSDFAYRNNGLDRTFADPGRAGVTGRDEDHGKFKTPSLRNVGRTDPYMHDGRFGTLERVVEHYAGGIRPSPTLDPVLAAQPAGGITLSAEDKRALVAFLKTLTEVRLEEPRRPARN